MTGDGVDQGLTTNEQFGHFVYWVVTRHPESRHNDEEVFELIRAEYPYRLDESRWPDRSPRVLQPIPLQRRYSRLTPERLGIRSPEYGREVIRRIDEKIQLLRDGTAAIDRDDDRFVTSRGQELPTTGDEENGWQWFNMWNAKLWPFSELAAGNSLYWYDSIQKAIVWKTEIMDVARFPYRTKQEARHKLIELGHEDPAEDPYFEKAKEAGYCLSYRVTPVRKLHVPKPPDFKFPQSGWLRGTDAAAQDWMNALSAAEAELDADGLAPIPRRPNPLSLQARRLLRELATRLAAGTILAGQPRTYPRYKQIHDALDIEMHGEGYGISLKHQGLEELALWVRNEQHPALTGIVVDDVSNEPNPAYFRVYGQTRNAFEWWERQVREALQFDWRPFIGEEKLEPDPPPLTPVATDLAPPERIATTEYRILRDTALARRIKELHGYRCQICGQIIQLPDGTSYAEAHHIRPLGTPHGGHDVAENILCVCPNDHVRLDLATIPLDLFTLNHVEGHAVGPEYIEYHNSLVRDRW